MSYYPPPGQPPYGAPQGQPQYGAPPQGQPPYGAPQGQQPYGAPPHGQQPYGAPQYPPQGQQPFGAPQYPPQNQPYGQPPQPSYGSPPPSGYPPQGYGQPQQYPPPQQNYYPPTPPSPGYGPPSNIAWDGTADANTLRKAMKGFGTDEKALISVLATKDPLQMAVLRQTFNYKHSRNLEDDIKSETGGHFEDALLALVRGPLQQDVFILHKAMSGPGTKEAVLNDVLLSRSNADMAAIKQAYQKTYHRSLEADVKGDLSMKTERYFMMVLAGNRAEDSAPAIPQQIDLDVQEIYKATEGKMGTDELLVCSILTSRNDAQIRAISQTYEAKFRRSLEVVIRSEFSGHMEKALIHQLRGGNDRVLRDALLLEDAMAGVGTQDGLLINRVVRYHWDRDHMQQVKAAYRHRFHKDLGSRIRGETSGDYETLLLACIGG